MKGADEKTVAELDVAAHKVAADKAAAEKTTAELEFANISAVSNEVSDDSKKVKKIKLNTSDHSDIEGISRIKGISQLENSEFSSQTAAHSGISQDTSKAGCSPWDSKDVSRDEFSGSEGSDLVAGQVLQMNRVHLLILLIGGTIVQ